MEEELKEYQNKYLTLICSYLYNNEYENNARFEIYKSLESKTHPRCKIFANFSEETLKTIERIDKLI